MRAWLVTGEGTEGREKGVEYGDLYGAEKRGTLGYPQRPIGIGSGRNLRGAGISEGVMV